MQSLPGRTFIVGGDFNAARQMDGARHSKGGNQEFFRTIEEAGFVNCVAPSHETEEVQTYFKKGGGPYQLDHLHADRDLAEMLTGCRVLTGPVEELDLSDHAPWLPNSTRAGEAHEPAVTGPVTATAPTRVGRRGSSAS